MIRRLTPDDPQYFAIRAALDNLPGRGDTVVVTAQNMLEFQALAMRPTSANGWGLTTVQASAEARTLETLFPMLEETPAIYPIWRELIDRYDVRGRQVYDARLAAVMLAHGVTHILTLDPGGFRRYEALTVVSPQELL